MRFVLLILPKSRFQKLVNTMIPCLTAVFSKRFLEDIENIIDILEHNPKFQIWTEEFRAIPLNTFPYLIFFKIYEKEKLVKIVAVFHTSQNPDKYPL